MQRLTSTSLLLLGIATSSLFAACGDDTGSGASATGGGGEAAGAGGAGAGPNGGGPAGGGGAGAAGGGGAGGAGGAAGGNGGGGAGGAACGNIPLELDPPALLSETGLYSDIATDTIAPYILAFSPKYPLWSDGATKARWAYIPTECGEQIDTTDMDTWEVPVGSRFWKEFTRDGVRVETRLTMRTGTGPSDYEFAVYHWDGSGDAVLALNGLDDANGTGHDIPPVTLCSSCHKSDWRVLGFSAIQLTHTGAGATMASLSADGVLTTPLPAGITIPGTQVESDALGYLHANCGNCHYDGGVSNVPMHLRVLQSHTTVLTTDTYLTAVGIQALNYNCAGGPCELLATGFGANNAANSAVIERMVQSTMPPFASEIPDNSGVATVSAWINSLP